MTLETEIEPEAVPDPTDDDPAPRDVRVEDVDADTTDEEEESPTEQQALRYYGVDFDVEGLVRRFGRKDLIIPSFDPATDTETNVEGFQRRFVWPKKQMDRFIESLLLGYPVPGVFLVEQTNRKFLILDGQQRIRTLHQFYEGEYETSGTDKVFTLEYVGANLKGLRYKTLPDPDKRLLDSTLLQATIVVPQARETSEAASLEAVYRVFERINSSGIKLQPQEIRVALFSGPLIRLLRDLNSTPSWRKLFGPAHSRLKDHELILRYLALLESSETMVAFNWDRAAARNDSAAKEVIYKPAMTTFLNSYLSRHRGMENLNPDKLSAEFVRITDLLAQAGGRDVLRFSGSQVNAAHTDAVLVGAALALRDGVSLTPDQAAERLQALVGNPDYASAVVESTSHLESVNSRLRLAYKAFQD